MKFRHIACILLPVSGLLSLPLLAQNESQPVPATMPSPSQMAPDTNATTPASTPATSGSPSSSPAPLQLQENPAPPPADTTPAAEVSSNTPTPIPTDTNGTPQVVTPPETNAVTSPGAGINTNNAPVNSNTLAPGPTPAPGEPPAPASDSGMGSPGQNPPASDPNSLIPPPEEPPPPSPINSGENEEKQREDQKARYYSVKVKADKEEALSSLWSQADTAQTDEAKRQALREYYDLLAKRMKKIDASLSDWIDTMHAAYLRRLEQVRVEPTIPLNLPPSVDEEASPTPEPTASPSATPHRRRRHLTTATSQASPSPLATPRKNDKDSKTKGQATPDSQTKKESSSNE